ncbi:MAG TPA: YjjG family noncanonical pyrimidine nucleotidase [Blastocatellia bacterium]|nr:YjjG family noncanonical pyrimidine nucleotidase [Blastocatellia bacterium]
MAKHYPWLWFDADGTLFDYHRSEGLALERAFQSVETPFNDEALEVYRGINRQLWQAFERREITPAALQIRRFELLMEALELPCSAGELGAAYLEQLAICAELIDGAQDLLQALHANGGCRFAIVTNGLQAVQRSRLALSPLRDYITELIISEEVGEAKPEPAFFAAAFHRLGNPDPREVLIIGDSLTSDMRGGADYGIDTCWYNPAGEPRPGDLRITYEIAHLTELLAVLGQAPVPA